MRVPPWCHQHLLACGGVCLFPRGLCVWNGMWYAREERERRERRATQRATVRRVHCMRCARSVLPFLEPVRVDCGFSLGFQSTVKYGVLEIGLRACGIARLNTLSPDCTFACKRDVRARAGQYWPAARRASKNGRGQGHERRKQLRGESRLEPFLRMGAALTISLGAGTGLHFEDTRHRLALCRRALLVYR